MARPLRYAARYVGRLLAPGVATAWCLGVVTVPADAKQAAEVFEAVRKADLDLGRIGWKLATANAALCDRLEPGLGFQLHTLDQFDDSSRDAARAHFGF